MNADDITIDGIIELAREAREMSIRLSDHALRLSEIALAATCGELSPSEASALVIKSKNGLGHHYTFGQFRRGMP